MNCETKNVIYLISCKKCGIQYVGETSQTLTIYVYQYFCSDGHSEEDILVMPLEEVTVKEGEHITLTSKRLQREDCWYKELNSIYP